MSSLWDPDDKIIGEGGFSHVKLVRLKTNKKLYALKCVVWSYKDRYAKKSAHLTSLT
jgi:hypothetical protein